MGMKNGSGKLEKHRIPLFIVIALAVLVIVGISAFLLSGWLERQS